MLPPRAQSVAGPQVQHHIRRHDGFGNLELFGSGLSFRRRSRSATRLLEAPILREGFGIDVRIDAD